MYLEFASVLSIPDGWRQGLREDPWSQAVIYSVSLKMARKLTVTLVLCGSAVLQLPDKQGGFVSAGKATYVSHLPPH